MFRPLLLSLPSSLFLFLLPLFLFSTFPLSSAASVAHSASTAAADWKKPSFCKKYDCPIFTLNSSGSSGNDYEVRTYNLSTWVRTIIRGRSMADAQRIGFNRLFKYIQGDNSQSIQIQMTVPVLTQIRPGLAINEYTVQFFLPFAYQANGAEPPQPDDPNLEVVSYKGNFTVAVRSFGGFGFDVKDQLLALQTDLANSNMSSKGVQYDPHRWFFAVYNSPWETRNRHNEVWLVLSTADDAKSNGQAKQAEEQEMRQDESEKAKETNRVRWNEIIDEKALMEAINQFVEMI